MESSVFGIAWSVKWPKRRRKLTPATPDTRPVGLVPAAVRTNVGAGPRLDVDVLPIFARKSALPRRNHTSRPLGKKIKSANAQDPTLGRMEFAANTDGCVAGWEGSDQETEGEGQDSELEDLDDTYLPPAKRKKKAGDEGKEAGNWIMVYDCHGFCRVSPSIYWQMPLYTV